MRLLALLASIAWVLGGCAVQQPLKFATGPWYSGPPPSRAGYATLYIYRVSSMRSTFDSPDLLLNNVPTGTFSVLGYTVLYVKPGTYEITVKRQPLSVSETLGRTTGEYAPSFSKRIDIGTTGEYFVRFEVVVHYLTIIRYGASETGPVFDNFDWLLIDKAAAEGELKYCHYLEPKTQVFSANQ